MGWFDHWEMAPGCTAHLTNTMIKKRTSEFLREKRINEDLLTNGSYDMTDVSQHFNRGLTLLTGSIQGIMEDGVDSSKDCTYFPSSNNQIEPAVRQG